MSLAEETAAALGLRVVRELSGGLFGASLVSDRDGVELVLKVQDDAALAPVWATGAATATRLRADGYPASEYRDTGQRDAGVWSLQEVLPGAVPPRLDVGLAEQLVALVRRHAVDSGMRRPWRDDAIAAARGWLAPGLNDVDAATLRRALDEGVDADLVETAIVHGDFHFRNCLVENGLVSGVFDWEIAGPGDWRFDLVNFGFWCLIYPKVVDADARDLVLDAIRVECPPEVSALMFACQALRTISMQGGDPEVGRRVVRAVAPWLVS
jgi:Phosphotransferase enzyme family